MKDNSYSYKAWAIILGVVSIMLMFIIIWLILRACSMDSNNSELIIIEEQEIY